MELVQGDEGPSNLWLGFGSQADEEIHQGGGTFVPCPGCFHELRASLCVVSPNPCGLRKRSKGDHGSVSSLSSLGAPALVCCNHLACAERNCTWRYKCIGTQPKTRDGRPSPLATPSWDPYQKQIPYRVHLIHMSSNVSAMIRQFRTSLLCALPAMISKSAE